MDQQPRDVCVVSINGQHHMVGGKHASMMLAIFLRHELRLTGTKIVCGEGDCGACTVLCWRKIAHKKPIFAPINACIVTMAQLDGCHVVTVEGLKQHGAMSAVQQAMVDHHGSQCGYCTPGFVMAMTALFENPTNLTEQKVKNALTGNLCRCTGYQPIIKAALSIDQSRITPLGQQLPVNNTPGEQKTTLRISDGHREIFAPVSLDEATWYKQENPQAGFLGGATDVGVTTNKGKPRPQQWLSLHLLEELYEIKEENGRIIVGARATLADIRLFLKARCKEFASFIDIFASPQIKNMATVVGNVANASPIGDTIPFFLVTDGAVHTRSVQENRLIPLTNFYQGYKITALKPNEIITHLSFALPHSAAKLRLEKVSQRKDLDISTVNAAFLFLLDGTLIKEPKLAFGGIDAVVKRLVATEKFLTGRTLSTTMIDQACAILQQEISPLSDLRGSKQYRSVLAEGLFRRYCHEVLP